MELLVGVILQRKLVGLLLVLALLGTIVRRVARRVTDLAPDVRVVAEELFGARVELVTLLPAGLAPHFASGSDVHQH